MTTIKRYQLKQENSGDVTAVSVANPSQITTNAAHNLATGDTVVITNTSCTPDINAEHIITFVDSTNFTIPVNVTVVTTGTGEWGQIESATAEGVIANELDSSDTDTRISVIARDLIEDTDHYANSGATPLYNDFTTELIRLIDIKLPDFQQNFTSIGQCLEELANIGNAYYGVDGACDTFMHIKGTESSGLLITNDIDNAILNNWQKQNYCVLVNQPSWYADSIVGNAFPIIHGIGYERVLSDDKHETSNNTQDTNAYWIAFPFTPERDNVSIIAPFLSSNTDPPALISGENLIIEIVEETAGGIPSGSIKARVEIPSARLEKELTTTGKYFEIAIPKLTVVPKTKYFIVIQKYSSASKIFLSYLDTGGARTWYESDDGGVADPWSSTGHTTEEIKFREYSSKSTRLVIENTAAKKQFGDRETVFPLDKYTNRNSGIVVGAGISESISRENRTFPTLTIIPPDNEVKVGRTVRITDVSSGFDMTANILKYSIAWDSADPNSNLGATEMELTVERLSYG
jgi:hypothetical protein